MASKNINPQKVDGSALPTSNHGLGSDDLWQDNGVVRVGTTIPESSASSGGVLGIADSSGVYTYYDTYTLAMAAATEGDVVEQFGNITETGSVTITVPLGVSINMNGYTYNLTGQSVSAFINNSNNNFQKVKFINGTINHTGTGGGSYIYGLTVGNSPILDCTGLTVISDAAYCLNFNTTGPGIGRINGGSFINVGNSSGWASIIEGHVTNAYFNTDTCTSGIRVVGGSISNSLIDGIVTVLSGCELNNCRVVGSAFGYALSCQGTTNNCYITSATERGANLSDDGLIFNSHIISNGDYGVFANGSGVKVINCKIFSETTAALRCSGGPEISFCDIETVAYNTVWLATGKLFNCRLFCNWDSSYGNVVYVPSSDNEIIDCYIKASNINAHAFTGNTSNKIRGNTATGISGYYSGTTSNSLTLGGDQFNNSVI
tara:strand:+ start:1929 stop:3224 length:1296 start_codon:yes stop_codon:yes gene_type:complete